ncbi:MAG: GHKL domain-containing protein [Oscillospiraceae bacterium]|nr:GHKL domain-containing protein [Oscillospiraceae bacterium]
MTHIDFYHLVYLICNLFSVVIIHKFSAVLFQKRIRPRWLTCIAYLSYFFATSFLYLQFNIPMLTLAANLLTIFVISMCYEATWKKRVLSCVFIYIFMLIPEMLIGALTGYFHFSIFTEGSYSNVIGLVLIRVATYMEALLIHNFRSMKKEHKVSNQTWIASIMIPVISFVLLVLIISADGTTQFRVLLAIILAFLLNITAFYLYDSQAASYLQRERTQLLEQENKWYYNQCQLMQSTSEDLQQYRHDMNNQLSAVCELLEGNRYEEAHNHLAELTGRLHTRTLYSNTGNVIVDGMINYKLQNAADDHITVRTELAIPSDLNFDVSDMAILLGNLLDNAMEAILQVEPENRTLYLKLVYLQGRLLLRITNPYKTTVQKQGDVFLSTKKKKTEHGLGLKSVRRVVEVHDGYMHIQHNEQVFDVDVLLYILPNNQ